MAWWAQERWLDMSAESARLEERSRHWTDSESEPLGVDKWVNPLIDTGERLGVLTDVWCSTPYLASVA